MAAASRRRPTAGRSPVCCPLRASTLPAARPALPPAGRGGYHALMSESLWPLWTETLPEPLQPNPLELAAQWLAQARTDAAQPNPNAMVLATVDGSGQPSARVVLCKDIDTRRGHIVFYTNY